MVELIAPPAARRSQPLWLALAIVPAWFSAAVLVFGSPGPMKVIVGAMLVLSLWSPYRGLLAAAVAAPLGNFIGTLAGTQGFRLTEAIVLAFLTGWLLHPADDRRGPRIAAWRGWMLAAVAVASVAMQAWELSPDAGQLADTFGVLFYGYYLLRDRIGFGAAMRIAEGIGLTMAVLSLFRRKPSLAVSLPAALAVSSFIAAAASILLWKGIAPAEILRRHALIGYRVSAHIADVNAAGSYYAMTLCAALGMALRARGRTRLLWLCVAAANTAGIWLSVSRSTAGALLVVLAAAAAWFVTARWSARAKLGLVAVLVVAGVAIGLFRIRQLSFDPDYRGAGFREQFNATSARMVAARPLSGVGIGQYFTVSPLFLGPQIAFSYGAENAHNYFLQLASELGLPGFAVFLLWMAGGLVPAGKALTADPRDARLLGLTAGAIALLGTSVAGHPLLVDEVAAPFWMQFGLMAGLAGSTLAQRNDVPAGRTIDWRIALAAAAILMAQLIRPELRPVESRAVNGLYDWETGADGVRYRWTGEFSSVFVPADVTRVYIPVRMPAVAGLSPMTIEPRTTSVPAGQSAIGDRWAVLNLDLPDAVPPTRFKRINLRVDRLWQPALYMPGSDDMRSVGVQMGEIRMFREH